MPYLEAYQNDEIVDLSNANIALARSEWDSFEISHEFSTHPLVRWSKKLWDATTIATTMNQYYGRRLEVRSSIELCYLLWRGESCKAYADLKRNEERLNEVFIDYYDLTDELLPDVDAQNVTIRKADLERDIKSLISYLVGVSLGRYSIDIDGLTFAGGEWREELYKTYPPDGF